MNAATGYLMSPEARLAYVRRFAYAQALDRCLRVFRKRIRVRSLLAGCGGPALRITAWQVDCAAVRAEELARIMRRRTNVASHRTVRQLTRQLTTKG